MKAEQDLRVVRVEKAVRDIIAQAVVRGLRDVPRGPVTITRVEVVRDFKSARVFVSIFLPDELQGRQREDKIAAILFGFDDAEDDLRALINKQLRLKHIPHLEFVLDTGMEKMARMTKILDSVRKT